MIDFLNYRARFGAVLDLPGGGRPNASKPALRLLPRKIIIIKLLLPFVGF